MTLRMRILVGVDIIFSSVSVICLGLVGNSFVAGLAPHLHDGAAWYSRWLVKAFTAPATLLEWALPTSERVLLLVAGGCLVGEWLLILGTPFITLAVRRTLRAKGMSEAEITVMIKSRREELRRVRLRLAKRVSGKLIGKGFFLFAIGAASAGLACAVIALVNLEISGFWQFVAAIGAIFAIILVGAFVDAIADAMGEMEPDPLEFFNES